MMPYVSIDKVHSAEKSNYNLVLQSIAYFASLHPACGLCVFMADMNKTEP